MSTTIRIKRRAAGGAAGAPTSLANAELAFNEQDHVLYYGFGTGGAGGTATSVIPIGGSGAFASTDSPAFTGIPTAPTAAADTDTTQIATTAFVLGQAGTATPSDLGTAATGVSERYAREDHVHNMPTHSQVLAPTADVGWGGYKLTGVADPASPQDAATKSYVDSVAAGLSFKSPVVAATAANITLSGTQTIDGVAVAAGDRVLVKAQTSATDNGIYVASASSWSRAVDADAWPELVSAFVFVEQGDAAASTGWVCRALPGGTLGTDDVEWAQFSAAGTYTSGDGLDLTGSVFSVVGTADRITVSSSGVDISAGYVGQSSITTLGTITTGTWTADTIGVAYGGTGATTLTGYVKGTGTSALTASATIPSTDISGLGTMSVQDADSVDITGGTIDGVTFDGGSF